MDNEQQFFNVPNSSQKDTVINEFLEKLNLAREKAGFPTNSKGFDEDVNLYISHLLFAVSMPNYKSITEQYISLHQPEVNVLADMAEDNYLKYFIYKVNADNLLIHLGIYQDLASLEYYKKLPSDTQEYLENAREFYQKSLQLNKKIYKRKTAIFDVLSKLIKNIDGYVNSLSYLRKSFYLFLNRFEDNEFSAFLDHMKLYENKMDFSAKQNLFLDLYSKWLKDKNPILKEQINSLCNELHMLDSSFNFSIDE